MKDCGCQHHPVPIQCPDDVPGCAQLHMKAAGCTNGVVDDKAVCDDCEKDCPK